MNEEFLKKLKDLLTEYSASIYFSVGGGGSDTYALYDEKIQIMVKSPDSKYGNDIIKEVDGWGIGASDL